jgi:hypothetical protein
MRARTAPLVLLSVKVQTQTVPIEPSRRRGVAFPRLVLATFVVLLSLVALVAYPSAAAAEPAGEGGTAEMFRQLDEAQRAWLDAKTALDASVARQQELVVTLSSVQEQLQTESEAVGKIAHNAFISAGFTAISGIMAAGSADSFLDGMILVDAIATREANLVRTLLDTQKSAELAQAAINSEIASQETLLAEMDTRKQQAQQALWAVGGGQEVAGFSSSASAVAAASPRNANGGWSGESCSVYEATTGGCITPRTAHARDQAQAAGFTRFVACYRSLEDGGQHPRGRACDFAVQPNGCYCGTAEGEPKDYGTNLAAFYVFNAQRLGVLYVIWYRQIWLPSSGWRSYSGCCDASSMHTNHVHLSMY